MLIATRRRRGLVTRLGATLTVALALTTVLTGAPAYAAATAHGPDTSGGVSITGSIANGTYRWANAGSGLCLAYAPRQKGAAYQQNCATDVTAPFYAANVGGNDYQLVNEYNGQCLSIWGGSSDDGAAAFVYNCGGTSDQVFTLIPATLPIFSGAYQLRNVHSGRCVAVGGGKTNPGAWVIQWGCAENGAYMWRPYN